MPYEVSYGGIPFVNNGGKVVRMGGGYAPFQPTAGSDQRRQQPLDDVMTELDKRIPFLYLDDFQLPNSIPNRNLSAIAHADTLGPNPNSTVRVGDFYYPTGMRRWSVFRGLATSRQVRQMVAKAKVNLGTSAGYDLATSGHTSGGYSLATSGYQVNPPASNTLPTTPTRGYTSIALPFVMTNEPEGAKKANGTFTVTTDLYMLPPRVIGELGGRDAEDGLYLVTLVDERFFAQSTPALLHPQQGYLWANVFNELATALGISLHTQSDIEDVYTHPELDSQFWSNAESAAVLLDAAAYNCGRVVVRRYDGTYILYTPSESDVIAKGNRRDSRGVVRYAGGEMFASGNDRPAGDLTNARNVVIPNKVHITFPKYVVGNDPVPHFVDPRYYELRRSTWYEDSYGAVYQYTVPIESGGVNVSGQAGTSEVYFHDTAKALLSGEVSINSGVPLNNSGLVALSMRLAKDYYDSQALISLDEVYPGVVRWDPEGLNDVLYTVSDKAGGAFTRVMRKSWTDVVEEYQHGTPNMSGFASVPGFGGHTVAQTIRDQFGISGSFIGNSGTVQANVSGFALSGTWVQSGAIGTVLNQTLLSGQFTASFASISHFPTNHRWYGKVIPTWDRSGSFVASGGVITSGESEEVILFEGTSGGRAGPYSGNYVGIVQRGVQGTIQQEHPNQTYLMQVMPDAAYAVNLTTYEKGQYVYPGDSTSGGVQEVRIVPQTQTVRVMDTAGVTVSGITHFSGLIMAYDPSAPTSGGPWVGTDNAWVVSRTSGATLTGSGLYDGQFVGYSIAKSGMDSAPIYSVDPATTPPPLILMNRQGVGGSSAKLKQPLFSGQQFAVLDSVDRLPTIWRWFAHVTPTGFFQSGETLYMEGTSGGLTSGKNDMSGFQYYSGGFWSGVIPNPNSVPDDFGFFVRIIGRGIYGTSILSGVDSGRNFRKEEDTGTQGWSSGDIQRITFTNKPAGTDNPFSTTGTLEFHQMSFPGGGWVTPTSGLNSGVPQNKQQLIVPQFAYVKATSTSPIYYSGSVLYEGVVKGVALTNNQNFYTQQDLESWPVFLQVLNDGNAGDNAGFPFYNTVESGHWSIPVNPNQTYYGALVGFSCYVSGLFNQSGPNVAKSRPIYVIDAPVPETAQVYLTASLGNGQYDAQYLRPARPYNPPGSENIPGMESGAPVTVTVMSQPGQNLTVGRSYNARWTGYATLYTVDRIGITVVTNGLTWPDVTTIRLDGTSGGFGMFASVNSLDASGNPYDITLFHSP